MNMNNRVHIKKRGVNRGWFRFKKSRPQTEAKSSDWSLRALGNNIFSRNLVGDNRRTHDVSRTDEINCTGLSASALAREKSGTELSESVHAPEEREVWRFVDTVYETVLTRVS